MKIKNKKINKKRTQKNNKSNKKHKNNETIKWKIENKNSKPKKHTK